jgi:hypothetical protein
MMNVVKYSDYETKSLEFEAPTNQKKKQTQNILLPVYNGVRSPLIQLPSIEIDMYGVPSKCDFYKEEYQRMFLKLPLNQTNLEVKTLTETLLKQLDEKFGSDEYKEKLFGKKASKYTYQPVVRIPITDEEKEKHPYMKIKLLTKYPTNEIQTAVIKQTADNKHEYVDGVSTLEDFEKHVKFLSKVKCMVSPVKLWMHPLTATEPSYGIAFKLVKVLVENQPERISLSTNLKETANFISDD